MDSNLLPHGLLTLSNHSKFRISYQLLLMLEKKYYFLEKLNELSNKKKS